MEKRPEGDLTREEKIKSLEKWCFGHACDPSHCRICELCQQFTGAWKDQPDDDIDKIFEALWEGPVNPQCEVKIENIKELMEEGYPASKEEIKAALLKSQEAKADAGKAIDGQRHWTPCSLKLPDKEGEYLVTNDAGGMKNVEIDTFAHYEDDGKPFWMTSQNPIAWMPIPDVYEKKEEKHEQ